MSINLIELAKCAKDAGLFAADINTLVAKEEDSYKQSFDREEKQRESDERQKERDLKREELEAQEREKQRAHELALAQRQSEAGTQNESAAACSYPGLKMPRFDDGKDDMDGYLHRFEKLACLQGWNSQNYHVCLGSLLGGKALKIYVSLPDDVLANYELLKDSSLKGYNVDVNLKRVRWVKTRRMCN